MHNVVTLDLRAAEFVADAAMPSRSSQCRRFHNLRKVIMGDFNSNAMWDKKRRPARDHSAMVGALSELGLVSSYHHFFGEARGKETRPTHYFRWHEHEPYHLDYCFIPQSWAERLVNVEVGSYEAWK
jgi:endonuclease/exonuclease/phosphatase family metal-dependent hydrolase